MPKYTDEDIRNMSKITCKIAADYLGISPMAVSIGMRNDLLPIGFAIHNEERDRTYSESSVTSVCTFSTTSALAFRIRLTTASFVINEISVSSNPENSTISFDTSFPIFFLVQ